MSFFGEDLELEDSELENELLKAGISLDLSALAFESEEDEEDDPELPGRVLFSRFQNAAYEIA